MKITKKIKDEMLEILETTYKDAKPALIFNNPFELLIAVILSAQCTDKRVNITTARLFAKANTPEKILEMGVTALEEAKEFQKELAAEGKVTGNSPLS